MEIFPGVLRVKSRALKHWRNLGQGELPESLVSRAQCKRWLLLLPLEYSMEISQPPRILLQAVLKPSPPGRTHPWIIQKLLLFYPLRLHKMAGYLPSCFQERTVATVSIAVPSTIIFDPVNWVNTIFKREACSYSMESLSTLPPLSTICLPCYP